MVMEATDGQSLSQMRSSIKDAVPRQQSVIYQKRHKEMCLVTLLSFPLQPFQFQFYSHVPSMLGFPGGSEVKNQSAMQVLQEMHI